MLPSWIERMVSAPRFAPYLGMFQGDGAAAWELYRWNIQVSAAFYGPLHWLEISLRNAEHDQLRAHYRRVDWWQVAPLRPSQRRRIDKALDDLRDKGDHDPSADAVVAELSFGFWVSLLNRTYDRHLWVPALHRSFPRYSGSRETLRDSLQAMVFLRNRIMHHEPIHHRHLAADHTKICRLLGYLEPEVARWLRIHDEVSCVLAQRPGRTAEKGDPPPTG
ncbi:hypothetical protein ACFYUK_14880 [Nonomuraea wenchangensis]